MKALSSKIHQILGQLEHVRQTGPGKWLARCPAHDDRSPSLAIREADDRILIHCFAGCGVAEILQAIGLDMADLFPERVTDRYGQKSSLPKFSAYELFPLLVQEAIILALAWSDAMSKRALSDADYQRVKQAYQCVMRLQMEVSK